MRDRHEEFESRGARVVAIGMGWPAVAAVFKERFAIPFPLLVDAERATYRALDIGRGGLLQVAGPAVWLPWMKAQLGGSRQGRPQQDAAQLGGALVVAPGGRVLFRHRATNSADNPPIDDLLGALG